MQEIGIRELEMDTKDVTKDNTEGETDKIAQEEKLDDICIISLAKTGLFYG